MIPQTASLNIGPDISIGAADCAQETLNIAAACNAHAGEALASGLVIGALVASAGLLIGLWVYGRAK